MISCSLTQLQSLNLDIFEEDCTAFVIDKYDIGSFLACEIPSGMIYEIPEIDEKFIEENFEGGNFVSGETEITFPGGAFIDKSDQTISSAGRLGGLVLTKKKNIPTDRRNLAAVTGDKTVLVVRVIATDGSTTANMAQLSDSVFGTDGDTVNLKLQYSDCSQEQLNIIPAVRSGITNGVITVNVDVSTSQGDNIMRNAIFSALNTKFGVSHPRQIANHGMYCLPQGTMKGIAYAVTNGWMSVYNDHWCGYVSAQLHEIGHNLNLGHSNENGTYRDQSCMVRSVLTTKLEHYFFKHVT